jgi:hypothetical protein
MSSEDFEGKALHGVRLVKTKRKLKACLGSSVPGKMLHPEWIKYFLYEQIHSRAQTI